MTFGLALSNFRHQKGKRQKAVAYALGMDPSLLSRIESGRKPPPRSTEFLERVSEELGLSADEKAYLGTCARADKELGEFVVGTTSEQLTLAMQFAEKLKQLTTMQVRAISAILDIEESKPSSAPTHIFDCSHPGRPVMP